jgi:undecaprenyl-diphosphatase
MTSGRDGATGDEGVQATGGGSDGGVWLAAAAFGAVLSLFAFVKIWDEVHEGDTQSIDEWVVRSLRRADDPAVPVGPVWVREAALDATALGGYFVIGLAVVAVVGFMWIHGDRATAWATLATVVGGAAATFALKHLSGRDRPDAVPHLRDVASPSFPSGHAALSAVVFLTLGLLLAGTMTRPAARLYCLSWAMLVSFFVGLSRIYLGVHYPSDVLGGWTFGLAWALAGWAVFRWFRPRRRLAQAGG